ncbi:pectin lyase fold/virulence factor [Cubamyces menziesii]|nr:pectin lyase fold/virulence factor [Cubamyces menziesii]
MAGIRFTIALLLLSTYVSAWKTFVVPHTDGQDDTPALAAALATGNYSANAIILFAKGTKYNIFTPIKFPVLNNVEVRIEGNLSYPDDIPAIQGIVGSSSFPGSWFTFTGGNNVTLRGSEDPNWGWVDGHGQALYLKWWDAEQQTNRPHGWAFSKITNGVIRDMKLWKPIAWNFATSGSKNIHAYNNKIVAVSSTKSFPFNTDGFSAGGTDLVFENNHIQNGDDCLTVGSGAKNIVFKNSYCEGGHGLSIGSLGKGGSVADVQNILIENVVMKNSLYAARFKSWTGGNGLARNVTWKNIAFDNVMFPIYVTQNYWDQGVGPRPNSSSTNNTHIQDFLFENFVGTINDKPGYVEGSCVSDPCWYAVEGATGKEVAILDLYPNTATNVLVKHVLATTETWSPVRVMCNATTITSDVGFKCWDGLFIPTKAGLL